MQKQVIDDLAIKTTHGFTSFGLQGRKYIKGEHRGKEKPFWLVDNKFFTSLWESVKPYVLKSVYKSGYYSDSMEREDTVQEIMNHLYWILYNYGPQPNGLAFHKQLALSVNNILTNKYNKSLNQLNYLNYNSLSLFNHIKINDSDSGVLLDVVEAEQSPNLIELTCHLTDQERNIVLYYLKYENKTETRKHFNISLNKLNKILNKCIAHE